MVINCLKLRDEISEKIKKDVKILQQKGVFPSFAIILIGNNAASEVYVRVKTKKAKELGIKTQVFNFQANNSQYNNITIKQYSNEETQQKNIEKLIIKLNNNPSINGIIIQRPIPPTFDEKKLQQLIAPGKDIDGLSENSPFTNPLVLAVNHALNYALSVLNSKFVNSEFLNLVVVGKGITAGQPIYKYFSAHPSFVIPAKAGIQASFSLNVSQIDSKTKKPDDILRSADIIISCVGKPRIINSENIKKGVILISVGQHQSRQSGINSKSQIQNSKQILNSKIENLKSETMNEKITWKGDYDENEINSIASAYTPTPGGVGPLNVIFLLKNVITAIK